MATKLNKPVTRELTYLRAAKNGRFDKSDSARPVLVTIDEYERITFRIKGTKRKYTLRLASAFEMAKANYVIEDYNTKMKTYKDKKENKFGRARRPKKPFLPWNKNFFEVIK